MGLDIGPDSVKSFSEALETTKTVIWNGPMGVFEFDKFAVGTEVRAANWPPFDCVLDHLDLSHWISFFCGVVFLFRQLLGSWRSWAAREWPPSSEVVIQSPPSRRSEWRRWWATSRRGAAPAWSCWKARSFQELWPWTTLCLLQSRQVWLARLSNPGGSSSFRIPGVDLWKCISASYITSCMMRSLLERGQRDRQW